MTCTVTRTNDKARTATPLRLSDGTDQRDSSALAGGAKAPVSVIHGLFQQGCGRARSYVDVPSE